MRTREEILSNYLGELKSNEKFFHITHGDCVVLDVTEWASSEGLHGVTFTTRYGEAFNESGRKSGSATKHPVAFKSLDHCIEYFQEVKKIEEEKNAWTLEKIGKAFRFGDKIKIKSPDRYLGKAVFIKIEPDGFSFAVEKGLNGEHTNRFHGDEHSWHRFEFCNWSGELIDPKEY